MLIGVTVFDHITRVAHVPLMLDVSLRHGIEGDPLAGQGLFCAGEQLRMLCRYAESHAGPGTT